MESGKKICVGVGTGLAIALLAAYVVYFCFSFPTPSNDASTPTGSLHRVVKVSSGEMDNPVNAERGSLLINGRSLKITSVAKREQDESDASSEVNPFAGKKSTDLIKAWLIAERSRDHGADDILWALTASLGASGSVRQEDVERELSTAFKDTQNSSDIKIALAKALASSDNLSAVHVLIATSMTPGLDDEFRNGLHTAISSVGSGTYRENIVYPEDLSPFLENSVTAAERIGDFQLANSLACAVARIGAPTGVRRVFALYERESHEQGEAVTEAELSEPIVSISNPRAISTLTNILRINYPVTRNSFTWNQQFEMSGGALLNINSPEAVRPVLDWLRTAPDTASPLVAKWFRNMKTPAIQNVTDQYLRQNGFFSKTIERELESQLRANRGVNYQVQ